MSEKIPTRIVFEIAETIKKLSTELAEARHLLDEARKQMVAARIDEDGDAQVTLYGSGLPEGTELYAAAPMPAQPAVPDDYVSPRLAADAYRENEPKAVQAISHCATLAHSGGMIADELDVLCAIRKITLPWFDGSGTLRQCEQRATRAMIFAAQQPTGGAT